MYNNSRREREDKVIAWALGLGLVAVLLFTNLVMSCM